jgi:hypothetical protein
MEVNLIAYLERYLDRAVEKDLARKMVFIGGPAFTR